MTSENSGSEHGMTEPPFTTRHFGAIKAVAVIMAVLIIVLTAVLVATIISRLSSRAAPSDAAELTLPAGAELRAASAADNGYVLVVDTPDGQEIWRVSPSGERLHVISVTQE